MISNLYNVTVIFPPLREPLKNLLEFRAGDSEVVYEALVPLSSFVRECGFTGDRRAAEMARVPQRAVYFHHTFSAQDGPKVYAFTSREERLTFRQMIDVDKIGPAIALKILSQTAWHVIGKMIEIGDREGFMRLPGVGPKTGQKLVEVLFADSVTISHPTVMVRPLNEDVVLALQTLGYKASDAKQLVRQVMDANPKVEAAADLVRICLQAKAK